MNIPGEWSKVVLPVIRARFDSYNRGRGRGGGNNSLPGTLSRNST